MDTTKAEALLKKHREGTLTREEEAMLEGWYVKLAAEQPAPDITDEAILGKKETIWNNLPVNKKIISIARYRLRAKIAAAAIVVICFGAYILLQVNKQPKPTQIVKAKSKDIAPGGNRAFLTLANGEKISLTGAPNGELATQAGIKISKTADGQLIYTIAGQNSAQGKAAETNTISTPHGGQWQVVLPDGTRVWLNASSSLKYPVSFAAAKTRSVELAGEAYFEVTKDKSHPFTLHTQQQDITVLGTHFNVSAYADERSIKTTLLEGSVSVAANAAALSPVVLKPGQQSVLADGKMALKAADTRAAVAWKNGMFYFEDDKLEDIMRRVARWYNVRVVYKNEAIKHELFSGRISRAENISHLLDMLSYTDAVKFKIEGRDIIVVQ